VPKARRSVSGLLPTARLKSFISNFWAGSFFIRAGSEANASSIKHAPTGGHDAFLYDRTIHAKSSQRHPGKSHRQSLRSGKKLVEAAGGKLISMYSTATNGPGVLVIFDVPDPSSAPAISGTVVAAGAIHNVNLTRLWTQDEITKVRQKAAELRGSYRPPGG
jgi:uncharacterized protein with GYD domain